jgi:uncharacterized protein YjbJ (UPF0337 family)
MDENRVTGTAKEIGGKAQQTAGNVIGDSATQAKGLANQAQGAAQDFYGKARDSASDFVGTASQRAADLRRSYEGTLRETIEAQPIAAVLVALGIGWLIGRLRQPL